MDFFVPLWPRPSGSCLSSRWRGDSVRAAEARRPAAHGAGSWPTPCTSAKPWSTRAAGAAPPGLSGHHLPPGRHRGGLCPDRQPGNTDGHHGLSRGPSPTRKPPTASCACGTIWRPRLCGTWPRPTPPPIWTPCAPCSARRRRPRTPPPWPRPCSAITGGWPSSAATPSPPCCSTPSCR